MESAPATGKREVIRLHIGGIEPREGWKILNVLPGPHVDYLGHCRDLSQFGDGTVTEIYASHVYEHLDYQGELFDALKEAHRVLKPGGLIRISVPDLDVLCRMFLDPALKFEQRWMVMRMIYGGHVDEHDYHYAGLNFQFMESMLGTAGFQSIRKVEPFTLFRDTSSHQYAGKYISLNVQALK